MKKVLAFDFGASGGRAILGFYDGKKISLKEIHRFSNDPVTVNGTMYWDVLRLFFEIKQGLLKAKHEASVDGLEVASLGIDTWGVDFGLLDKDGTLLQNPVHYRDKRTTGMLKESFKKLSKDEFYEITGNQFMEINTAFQLLSIVQKKPEILERADKMLLMPDLFNYMLTGVKASEYSIASTTQLFDARKGQWSKKVIDALGIPDRLFLPLIPSGTELGVLSEDICEELGIKQSKVISITGHDTQSALVAVPAKEKDFIFISCGTWSLVGTELDAPFINEKSDSYNITNEGGYGGKTSFLKNITGLWMIQESRRQWIREGREFGFGDLEQAAVKAEPFTCFINPDAPEFAVAGDLPKRIQEYLKRTGQKVVTSPGEIVRCINESLALKYRMAIEEIKDCTNKEYHKIYMVGGGVQSRLLCLMTANACGCEVTAGPVEATVLGNIAVQLMASGDINSLSEARELIGKSQDITNYRPQSGEAWEQAYAKFKALVLSDSDM